MNEKSFPINVTMWYDDYEERITKEQVNIDYDGIKGGFSVFDLCDCPEDAIIGRDLFTAYDFINAIYIGMDIAAKGYTKLSISETENRYE